MSPKPSLGSVLSGGGSGGRGVDRIVDQAGDLLKAHTDGVKMDNAGRVIRASIGQGDGQMDPISSAVKALEVGANLASDKDTKEREAAAAQANAQVEMTRARNEHEVSIAGLLADILHKGNGGGGLGVGDVLQLVNTLNAQQQPQRQGTDWAGIAALITAAMPLIQSMMQRNGGDNEAVLTEMRHQMDRLGDKLEQAQKSGGGQGSVKQMVSVFKEMQEVMGVSPSQSIEMRKLDSEERLGKYQLDLSHNARLAEHEYNGQLVGLLRDGLGAWQDGSARKSGQEAPDAQPDQQQQPSQAVQRVSVRCSSCGTIHPFDGTPPEQFTCRNCGQTIGRGAA